MMKGILSQKPWLYDPLVVDMPWRDEPATDLLTFGIMMSEVGVSPQPPVRRALEIMKSLVKNMGHDLIEWKPPSHQTALDIGASSNLI
jgi:amidase